MKSIAKNQMKGINTHNQTHKRGGNTQKSKWDATGFSHKCWKFKLGKNSLIKLFREYELEHR